MKIRLFFFLFFLSSGGIYSQSGNWQMLRQQGTYFRSIVSTVEENQSYHITTDFGFNAITIKYSEESPLNSASVVLDGVSFTLEEDPHSEGEKRTTALITTEKLHFSVLLNSGSLSGKIEVHLINSTYPDRRQSFRFEKKQGFEVCDQPSFVNQSVWRDGLDLPNTSRSFSNVKHLIIHHSAGSNTSSDWMEVVRSIFIYHTQSNGWSDIGYNYLIDPNGVLYNGRDPVGGSQDNVIGAHFCGKNSSTMGVCLMGTYTTIPPSDLALTTVKELFAWKANKETINVLSSSTHSGSSLRHVAGHRDGCATECPGQMTYELMSSIRTDINTLMEPCGSSSEPPKPPVVFSIYPNPVSGNTFSVRSPYSYQEVQLISSVGKVTRIFPLPTSEEDLVFEINDVESGLYTMVFQSGTTIFSAKLIVIK